MIVFTITLNEGPDGLALDCEGKVPDGTQPTQRESNFAQALTLPLHALLRAIIDVTGEEIKEQTPETLLCHKWRECHECPNKATRKLGENWFCDEHGEESKKRI